jgi:hypothetical protein
LPQNAKIDFKTFAMIYVDVHGIFMTGELLPNPTLEVFAEVWGALAAFRITNA